MYAMKAMVVAVGLLLAATPAGAMTGLEFLQAFDKSASDQAAALEPLVRQFVREGYHNVPDWSDLAVMARARARYWCAITLYRVGLVPACQTALCGRGLPSLAC
jgi:hypothetical protein